MLDILYKPSPEHRPDDSAKKAVLVDIVDDLRNMLPVSGTLVRHYAQLNKRDHEARKAKLSDSAAAMEEELDADFAGLCALNDKPLPLGNVSAQAKPEPATTGAHDQAVYAQNNLVDGRKELLRAIFEIGCLALIGLLVPILGTFEIGLSYNLMMELYGPEIPGNAIPINVFIMSLATIMGVVGFHVLKHLYPDHIALRALEKIAPSALLFFFVGMMLSFGMSDVASAPVETTASTDDIFDEPEAGDQEAGNAIMPIISLFSGFALGGLIIVNLIVIHGIINHIRVKLPGLLVRRQIAKAKIGRAQRIINHIIVLAALRRELAHLQTKKAKDLALETAAQIESAAAPVLRSTSSFGRRLASRWALIAGLLSMGDKYLPSPPPSKAEIDQFAGELSVALDALPDDLLPEFK